MHGDFAIRREADGLAVAATHRPEPQDHGPKRAYMGLVRLASKGRNLVWQRLSDYDSGQDISDQ